MAKHFLLIFLLLSTTLVPRPANAQNPATPQKPTAQKSNPKQGNPQQTTPAQSNPQQSKPYPITPADSAIHFADSIFHQPTLLYQLVQPDIPQDIQAILIHFNNALVANRQWFQDYRAAYAGKPLPYNERFGITPDEYKKLQNLEQAPRQLTPVDTQKVTVTREAGYIRFVTNGDVHLLDYLQIDLQKNLVVFGGDTIPLVGHTAANPASPYGEWQGYTWRLEKADAASTLATSRVTARVVEINMGLTPPSPQTPAENRPAGPMIFLRLKYQDMQDGATRANLELVGYLLQ